MNQIIKRLMPLFWICSVYLGAACIALLISFEGNPDFRRSLFYVPETPIVINEMVNLPVNTPSDVLTTNKYSDYVTITVRGEGRIDAKTRHNAFNAFNSDGSINHFNGFTIDGKGLVFRVFTFVPTPTNRSENEYQFSYYVDSGPRQIAFRMVNGNQEDHSVFVINVLNRNKFAGSGR